MNKYQEALDNITCLETYDNDTTMYDIVGEEIETLQELVDKETPKKLIICKEYYTGRIVFTCPNCGNTMDLKQVYCDNCGQKLDQGVKE